MNKNQSSGVDINTPMITREEYLNARRQAMIDAAYLNSLHRELPAVPMIANPESIEVFEDIKQRDIANAQEYIAKDPNNPAYRSWLESAKNSRYNPLVPGASCIYTFTDNYGKKYRCASNYKFKNMSDSERGFIQIPVSDMKPGDGMMHGTAHMAMFDSKTDDNTYFFNDSRGGDDELSIRKKRKLHGDFASNPHYSGWRFVGDKEDNDRWNKEYDEYRKNYVIAMGNMLKNVPIIHLPLLVTPISMKLKLK